MGIRELTKEASELADKVEVKLCKDCRYYISEQCFAPENMKADLVKGGKKPRLSVNYLRSICYDGCGEEGAWWEAK